MRSVVYSIICLCFIAPLQAQSVREKIDRSVKRLLTDEQMKYATLGLVVLNSETGASIYEHNAQTGMAPASCQKSVTSAAAFEILGATYRFRTELGYNGDLQKGKLNGDLYITGYGDPTLGSWRYTGTADTLLLKRWIALLKQKGIEQITGHIITRSPQWETASVPGGWIWDDMGNYYGAGAYGLNWRENQYDLILRSGQQEGDKVSIVKTNPVVHNMLFKNELRTGKKGSGDNAYIYLAPYGEQAYLRGTIPPAQSRFSIAGSLPDPAQQLSLTLAEGMRKVGGGIPAVRQKTDSNLVTVLHTEWSPTFDSINYWFMKKSVNLYGEAMIKAIAREQSGFASTDKGLELVKELWKKQGIDPDALRMLDGSGLSPQNRLTPQALAQVLQFARKRPWFDLYADAFPEYNKMRLKSGTIGGSKGFVGYHTSKEGITYTVVLLVNNYIGSPSEIVRNLFLVLVELT